MAKTKLEELKEWNETVFNTILGKRTIPQLNHELGLPKIIMEYAKVEKKTKSTKNPFVVVDVYVDGKLWYNDKLVIRGIKKSLIQMFDSNGIEVVYVRHPKYNSATMMTASESDMKKKKTVEHEG